MCEYGFGMQISWLKFDQRKASRMGIKTCFPRLHSPLLSRIQFGGASVYLWVRTSRIEVRRETV